MITKKQKESFNQKANQIMDELKTGRDISACLGSVGLTFCSDISSFIEFLLNERGTINKVNEDD